MYHGDGKIVILAKVFLLKKSNLGIDFILDLDWIPGPRAGFGLAF